MKSPKVVIIDYDVGNLLSVKRAFDYFSISAKITSDQKEIFSSSHVVFPGVGAFGAAMEKIKKKGLIDIINRVSDKGTPLLGICLGMQLIFEKSYEFEENNGLGLISGEVKEIPKTLDSINIRFVYTLPSNFLTVPTIFRIFLSSPTIL